VIKISRSYEIKLFLICLGKLLNYKILTMQFKLCGKEYFGNLIKEMFLNFVIWVTFEMIIHEYLIYIDKPKFLIWDFYYKF
jgi:hypothetical protein